MTRYANGRAIVILAAGLALAAGGCRKPGTGSSASSKPAYDPRKDPLVNPPSLLEPPPKDVSKIATGETLVLHLPASPNTVNPLFVSTTYDFLLVDVLNVGLFTFGSDFKWRINDEIVESFEESEDHTVMTVRMKPGFKWHDGVPLTAHDVVYSWQQILDPQVPCQTQKPNTEPIKECVALDDRTVKFVQPEPSAMSRWNLSFPIIAKHVFEKHKADHPDLKTGAYYNRLARYPVGSGPYRLVEWVENSKIVVERWEDYAGRKPYFKRLIFRIVPDSHVTLLLFEKQEIDVVEMITAQQFALETNTESFNKVGYKAWSTTWDIAYIGYNMDGSNPFFADRRVRYAMTHALNVPLIIDKVYYNLVTPCHGMYHPTSWTYNPEVKPLEYDLDKSRALLDKAGWKVDPKDGWRYKQIEGQKVAFEFTLMITQGSASAPKVAAILQQDLKQIGVRMKTRTLEFTTCVEKARTHDYQSMLAAWGTGVDPDLAWNLWRSDQYKTGRNYGGYSNPRIDELYEMGRAEFDFEARRKIYQEIHKIIYEDQPYTWVYNRPALSVFNKRIRGVQFSPRGIYGFDPSLYEWWVPKGQAMRVAAIP